MSSAWCETFHPFVRNWAVHISRTFLDKPLVRSFYVQAQRGGTCSQGVGDAARGRSKADDRDCWSNGYIGSAPPTTETPDAVHPEGIPQRLIRCMSLHYAAASEFESNGTRTPGDPKFTLGLLGNASC